MSFTESSLIIRWTESRSSRFHWFIRGLRPDGSFYGEVRSENESPRESDGATGVGCGIEGRISNDDIKHLTQLVAQIREHPCIVSKRFVNYSRSFLRVWAISQRWSGLAVSQTSGSSSVSWEVGTS